MTVTLLEAGLGALLLIVTPYAHEATHLAASTPWVKGGKIDLWRGTVEVDIAAETRQAVSVWISLAPLFVGLAGLGLLYAGGEIPALTRETFLLYASWGWFTTPSLMDLREAADIDHVEAEPDATRKAWYILFAASWGLIVMSTAPAIVNWLPVSRLLLLRVGVGLCMGAALASIWLGNEFADSPGGAGAVESPSGETQQQVKT